MNSSAGIAPRARILVIDDAPAIVELLREFPERQGYAVDRASNGRAGLRRVLRRARIS